MTTRAAATMTWRGRAASLWSLASLLLLVYLATLVASLLGGSTQIQAQYALVNLVIVVALHMFVGSSGVLSFGHIAFVAVGAWTVGLLTIEPDLKRSLLPDLLPFLAGVSADWRVAVIIGGLVGGGLAAVVAPFLMRLNGLQAGIATFALLGVVNQVLTFWSRIGPRSGQSMVGLPEVLTLQGTLNVALLAIGGAWLYQRTRSARLLRASREDGAAAPASGIDVTRQRVVAFVASGVVAGVAGGLWALTNRVVQASALNVELTFITLAMLVLGGTRSLSGAVVGTISFTALDMVLVALQGGITAGDFVVSIPQGTRPIVLGTVLVLMLLFRPSGLTGGREFGWPFVRRVLPGVPITGR